VSTANVFFFGIDNFHLAGTTSCDTYRKLF